MFLGESFPEHDLAPEIAQQWQKKIDQVFGSNVEELVRPSKDGIKIHPQAIQQNPDGAIEAVDRQLVKKTKNYQSDKVENDIAKYGGEAGEEAVAAAASLGLTPVANAERLFLK